MMRVQFAEGLQSQGVASNQVVLQSTSSGDFVLSAEGVVATFRLDVVSTNVDAVKSALESYVSSGKYDTALKGAASEFSSVKTQVEEVQLDERCGRGASDSPGDLRAALRRSRGLLPEHP